jgi:hypothetical protein
MGMEQWKKGNENQGNRGRWRWSYPVLCTSKLPTRTVKLELELELELDLGIRSIRSKKCPVQVCSGRPNAAGDIMAPSLPTLVRLMVSVRSQVQAQPIARNRQTPPFGNVSKFPLAGLCQPREPVSQGDSAICFPPQPFVPGNTRQTSLQLCSVMNNGQQQRQILSPHGESKDSAINVFDRNLALRSRWKAYSVHQTQS